jgi:Asp-tRNA(Asn)/Glu-tRNA(Gln) amidotransferase C subunit
MAEKKETINKLGKDLDKIIKDMKKASEDYAKADGEKRPELLTKLKDLTREKAAAKDKLAHAIADAEKDPMLNITEDKMPKLSDLMTEAFLTILIENVASDAAKAGKATIKLGQDLKAAGSDASDEEVQAAMLSALIDADGDISQVDVDDVEQAKQDIEEARGYRIDEAGSTTVHVIEGIFNVLGSAALLNSIAEKVEKATGKKVNVDQVQTKLEKILGVVKTVSGLPAKAMEKTFEWIAKKLGGGKFAQKIAGYSGTLVAVTAMAIFGVMHFPSAASGFAFVFALAGLLGKGAEMIKLVQEIVHAVREEIGSSGPSLAGPVPA